MILSFRSSLLAVLFLSFSISASALADETSASSVDQDEQSPEDAGLVQGMGVESSKKRDFMGMIGDSMSAGALADTATTLKHLPLLNLLDLGEIAREGWIAAFENKSKLSWGSGSKVNSHFVRLNAVSQIPVNVLNAAISGSKAHDTLKQATRIVEAAQSGRYETLRYLTFWIGANDACDRTPVAQMHDEILQSFALLAKIDQSEKIRVLVPSIPNIPQLGRTDIRQNKTANGYACEYIQKKVLKFCEPLLDWNTPEQFLAAQAVVQERNALLRSIVDEVNRTFPNIEAHFSDVPYNTELNFDMLAADCFHPNSNTQARLAKELWADQPWF